MSAERYGKFYWNVDLTDGRSLMLCADKFEVTPSGDLVAWRETDHADPLDRGDKPKINMAFAKGTWTMVYASSVVDGSAVAVEHWIKPGD